ncbi:MAG TPA: flagellar basal body P-ring formation chaperone FlgA [Telluria sp.]
MNAFRAFGLAVVPALLLSGAAAAATSVVAQVEQAAREQLEKQAAGSALAEPRFELTVATSRPAPPCRQSVAVEPIDTRQVARMRFAVRCADGAGWHSGGWQYEYVVRARVSALVVVTAAPVAANAALTDADITLERRDITAIADPVAVAADAVGQTSRRSLRAGEVLRMGQLAAPVLVRRGEAVVMLAKVDGIEVSTAGEALDAGSRGAMVRVRNAASGQVVRMRVAGAGTVEPIGLPARAR